MHRKRFFTDVHETLKGFFKSNDSLWTQRSQQSGSGEADSVGKMQPHKQFNLQLKRDLSYEALLALILNPKIQLSEKLLNRLSPRQTFKLAIDLKQRATKSHNPRAEAAFDILYENASMVLRQAISTSCQRQGLVLDPGPSTPSI